MSHDKRPPLNEKRIAHGTIVSSGGRAYESSPVGDRLEFVTSPRKTSPSVAPDDYTDYENRSSRTARHSSSAGSSMTARGGGKVSHSWLGGGRRELDAVPPGIRMKDVARRFLPHLGVRLAISGLAAVFAGILVYNIYMSFYVRYKTEIVTISPYIETIDVEGIAIRDETAIEGELSKTSVKAVRSGDKVSKGEPIVNTYRSVQEAAAFKRIAEIDAESEQLNSMITASEDSANSADNISRQLDSKMAELNACARNRSMSEVDTLKSEITYLLNKRMVVMRQVDDYNARIDQLEKEKEALQKQLTEEPKVLTSASSGYFDDSCDGYEALLNTSVVKGLTVDKLNAIMSRNVTPSKNVIGKLISSFTWYLACPVPAEEAESLIVGANYTLYLPYSEAESVDAQLERLNKTEGQSQFLALFKCNSLASELRALRRQPVKILKCRYEGFAVKKSALHAGVREECIRNPHPEEDFPRAHLVYINQVTYPSVYAVVAGQIVEKEVRIVYGTDKTVICSPTQDGSGFLELKDIVVTEERGLYNGKLVR